MMGCPDESDLVAFADGLLDGAARDTMAAHLDDCEDCATLVAVAVRRTAPAAASDATLPRGFTLGRYIVVDRLGEGGLGVVYSAYDPQLDRRIAVKVLKQAANARFEQEAKALARVAHPNVVAVYDAGVAEGHAFIAMELVDGVTLRAWLAATPRTWPEIRDVFVAAGRGLQAVHDAGLVHRDFKPGNVLVAADERVRVLDFGLARLTDGRREPPLSDASVGARSDGITPSGYVLGTPAYISPEQVEGGAVDSQTDQFSFAVALYEALFGVRPFPADDLRTRSEAVRRQELAPSRSDLRVPARLREAVLRGLAADPGDRYAAMAEFIDALSFDAPARRRLRSSLLALALIGVGAVGAAAYLRQQPSDAELEAVRALRDQAREAAARSFYIYPPAEAPATPTAYSSVAALEMLDDDGVEAAAELRIEFAATLVRLGDRYWDAKGGRPFAADYYVAALMFDPTHDHALQRAVVTPAQIARMQGVAATLEFSAAELVAARSLIALAEDDPEARRERVASLLDAEAGVPATTAEHLARLVGLDETRVSPAPERPSAPVAVADALPAPDEPTDARRRRKARTPAERPAPSNVEVLPKEARADAASAKALAQQGRTALRSGKLADAERLFHRALEADRRSLLALDGLREIYFERGAYRRAIGFAKRSVGVAPRDAKFRLRLGDLYYRVLQYADARTQYQKALDLGSDRAQARLQRLTQQTGG